MPSTMALNSVGVKENSLSKPFPSRSRTKCFSITFAPKATAPKGTSNPNVWSDNPTKVPNALAIVGITLKLT